MPDSADILPFEATETTLENGLRVIVVPTGFPNLVSLQIPVQTGSRNEVEAGKSGFAHFFEHMMFRGTKRFAPEAYRAVVSRAGARRNAYTTDDYTNYHATFAKEDLETFLEIEADRFMHLDYPEEAFRTEARAILGEYNKSSSDPLNKLLEVQREAAFQLHPYRHTTMGFIADIEAMPGQFDYSRTFFDRWYRPQFTTVIVAGDADPAVTVALVQKYWGAWEQGQAAPVAIPAEPEPGTAVAAHVAWDAPTLPWVSVAFHAPAFSTESPEHAALDTLLDLTFGETSDLYQELVERKQIVDRFFPYLPSTADPGLATVLARVKRPEDALAVRNAILQAVAQVRAEPVDARRLEDAKSHARYGFARTLDNSESIAGTLARFVRFERSYGTLNRYFGVMAALQPADLLAAARRYLAPERMVLTTLSREPLDAAVSDIATASREPEPAVATGSPEPLTLPSALPLVRVKLLFTTGSADDPPGKEGLSQLSARMIVEAGSAVMRIDEINRALFPIAGTFGVSVDREMTAFTGVVHREMAERFADIVLPQIVQPGYREEDFKRLKESQRNALVQDLRANNDEELGKEVLQSVVFGRSEYGHPALGTVAGIEATTLDDVKGFVARSYSRARLTVGLAGAVPEAFTQRLQRELARLPAGEPHSGRTIEAHWPAGLEVTIVEKETRATAISFGHAIPVLRDHPDFAALWLARSWLGEHRASNGRLFERLRDVRGLNYGDYAYIEAFPGAMYRFFPEANIARRAQLFEVWVRPVVPEQAVFALKVALHELRRLIAEGLTQEQFEATREYLSKNVFLMTRTQDQQLGYALDSRWWGLPEFTTWMREELAKLTGDNVNNSIRRHLSGEDLAVVMITKDAAGLRAALLSGEPAAIAYDAQKPQELLDEDALIGALPLGLTQERVRIVPIEDVFAR